APQRRARAPSRYRRGGGRQGLPTSTASMTSTVLAPATARRFSSRRLWTDIGLPLAVVVGGGARLRVDRTAKHAVSREPRTIKTTRGPRAARSAAAGDRWSHQTAG